MRASGLVLTIVTAVAALLFHPAISQSDVAKSEASESLAGQVTSTEEGPMEGVLVSAKKAGSTISVTVVSDEHGRYRFPAGRLEPGHYALRIRAGGYDLDSPSSVDIPDEKGTTADIKLRKTSNLASQLANSDWLASFPGTPEQKSSIQNCSHCHTFERIVRSTHDADEFVGVLERMSRHTPESFPLMVQPDAPGRLGEGEMSSGQEAQVQANRQKQAAYLATLNLSSVEQWQYPLQIAPRPKGKATQVIVTEYDLPKRTRQPHDVVVDSEGTVWYASFGEAILGKLDPKTGKVTEYPMPVLKPGHIIGNLDVEFDEDQNLWVAMTFQGAVAKFDRKTEKFTIYRLPPDMDGDYRESHSRARITARSTAKCGSTIREPGRFCGWILRQGNSKPSRRFLCLGPIFTRLLPMRKTTVILRLWDARTSEGSMRRRARSRRIPRPLPNRRRGADRSTPRDVSGSGKTGKQDRDV